MQSQLTTTFTSRVQAILRLSLLSSWDYRHVSRGLAYFVFLVETGFLHVGQGGLELPISGDPPASTSQSAEMTGMSHRTWRIATLKFPPVTKDEESDSMLNLMQENMFMDCYVM